MIAGIYLLPVFACLLLRFGFDFEGKWTTYLWILVAGEATVGSLHLLFYWLRSTGTEYLGSLVESIHHENEWTEIILRNETRRDAKGNSYTVTRTEYRKHPEQYYFFNTRNKRTGTDSRFFNHVRNLWGLSPHHDVWKGSNILGGERYGQHYRASDMDSFDRDNPAYWVPVTEKHRYRNRIVNSNSIFRFEKISKKDAKEENLFDYPGIIMHDAECILSEDFQIDEETRSLFRKFNGRHAPSREMRLYVLLFPAEKGVGVTHRQRAYWDGGNKNEFIICLGLTGEGKVEWANTFSWSDNQQKEVETTTWFLQHPEFQWQEFHDWFLIHSSDWKRKEFSDFRYINVSLALWQMIIMAACSILENIVAIRIALTK